MDEWFDRWNEVKKRLHANNKTVNFHERDVWWYAAGKNIGHEINGKGQRFSRPILIVRKYGRESFFGVPLSTRKTDGRWFEAIKIGDDKSCALLSQSGSFSSVRLYERIGTASKDDFERICNRLIGLIFKT